MSNSSDLTLDQHVAVTAPGSVVVLAGAGTGKTHMLAHRYVHHLREGLRPLQVVAVTFTEKAAAELRARVRSYARSECADRPELLAELEAAQISTIHALATRVCREFPDEAEVPPDFAVLDTLEGSIWRAEMLEGAIATLPGALFEHVQFDDARAALALLLADPVIAEEALAHDPEQWPQMVKGVREDAVRDTFESAVWSAAAEVVRTYRGVEGDKREDVRRQAEHGLGLVAAGNFVEGLPYLDAITLAGGKRQNWPAGTMDLVKQALTTLRDETRSAAKAGLITLELGAADARLAIVIPRLRAAFLQCRAYLDAAKRRERVLEFADLEAHALRALAHADVRAYYGDRWKALLVDEVQDTNSVQEQLLVAVSEACLTTIVGDDKQGIYTFRGADATVFERMRSRVLDHGGRDVVLRESFRTHDALVDTVNQVFEPLLGERHQALVASRKAPPHAGPHCRRIVVGPGRGSKKAQRQVIEARAIATEIQRLLDDGVTVLDKRSSTLRPVRAGDIAVLSRSWASLDVYAEVLPGLGVPAVHAGGGNLLDTREAKDAMALLRFLADPHDDLALVSVLRAPFFAVDDRALWEFARSLTREGSERPSWWMELVAGTGDTVAALARPVATLQDLVRGRRAHGPSRMLALADVATGYTAVIANLPGAARREADWSGMVAFVRGLERGLDDVFTVSRRLRRLVAAGVEVPRVALEAGDAVALMTIHRSKGAEWPVVFVSDLARGSATTWTKVRMDRSFGVALELSDNNEFDAKTPCLLKILKQRRQVAEREEVKRVLYVALTRARDVLVLTSERENGGLLSHLTPRLEAAGVPREVVAYDGVDAAYPSLPVPVSRSADETEGMLNVRPEVLLGRLADQLEPKTLEGTMQRKAAFQPPSVSPSWTAAIDYLEMIDSPYLPLATALRDAEAPAPDADGIEAELTIAGRGQGMYAVLQWTRAAGVIALVEPATAERDFDAAILRLRPTDPEAMSLLQAALA